MTLPETYQLSEIQQNEVIDKTRYYIDLANQLLNQDVPYIDVKFNLRGKASGMFVVNYGECWIRYNQIIFSRFFDHAVIHTVAHEVAHYIVHMMWGIRNVKPHGHEWVRIMDLFSLPAEVTGRYDISNLPLKKQQRHLYGCACMQHSLSTTRHNKISRKQAVYSCKKCEKTLVYITS